MSGTTALRLIALFVTSLCLPATGAVVAGGGGSLTVTVDPSGTYDIAAVGVAWHFHGDVGYPLSNIQVASGSDGLGPYLEIGFDFQSDTGFQSGTGFQPAINHHAAIRSYWDHPDVLFTVSNPAAAPNTFKFPNFSQYPQNLDHLTFSGIFAPPTFWDFSNESPWVFFDSSFNTFVLSPAANFMAASTAWGPKGELASGIAPAIASLPQGFEHRTLLVVEKGINRAFDTWGQALTALHGKIRPASDAGAVLNKVGYWTDNGATYYYHTADALSYQQTLAAVKGDFDRLGIGLGYLQLDSWFYPKGSGASWSDNGDGIYEYVAAAPPFVEGLSRFQQSLGVPLITHARWIDASSPYRTQYQMSGNVVLDPAYWNYVAGYLATSGVATYEQDWLDDKAQPAFNLTDAETFLDNMAAAMAQRQLTLQYCMASPRHFMQSSKYSNLTTIRTSADRLGRDRWTEFLYTSRFASALGIWPFTDNFMSAETNNMLVAALSAGPVGLGDPIGALNAANLLRAVRRDGVIVKPDVPLTPADSSYASLAHNVDAPQIATTYSDFGALRTNYWFAYPQGTNRQATFSPAGLGVNQRAYLYDYFTGSGQVVNPSDVLARPIAGDALYLVAAPIGPSGMAVVGDVDQFVTMGKKRVPALTDDGEIHLTVAFANGETVRSIKGYSPFKPAARATAGSVGHVAYDAVSQQFQIPVMPGPDGAASIRILQARAKSRQPGPVRTPREPQGGGGAGSKF